MSDSIRLHKEHGLNPTMPVCIICNEEKGEIALLGANYKGEAPMRMVMDVEPCDKCRKKYLKSGVLLVEANNEIPKGKTKAQQIPTGLITVIRAEVFKQVFGQDYPDSRIVMVEKGILQMLEKQSKSDEKKKKK